MPFSLRATNKEPKSSNFFCPNSYNVFAIVIEKFFIDERDGFIQPASLSTENFLLSKPNLYVPIRIPAYLSISILYADTLSLSPLSE